MTESDACNLKGISPTDRPRYDELVKQVRAAMQKSTETLNGLRFLAGRQQDQSARRRRVDQHGKTLLSILDFSARNVR